MLFDNKLPSRMLFAMQRSMFGPVLPLALVFLIASLSGLHTFLISSLSFWLFTFSYYGYVMQQKLNSWRWKKIEQAAKQKFRFTDTEPKHIRVLSYNIFLRPPFIKNNKDDYKNERMSEFMKKMKDYDVIALQEIFNLGNTRQQKLIDYAKQIGFHFHARSVRPPFWSKKFIDAGLVILSKYPIVERDAIVYDFGNQIDSWAAKQVIYAKIQIGEDNYFHLFTTHMQATYMDSNPDLSKESDKARLGQVDQYAAFVRSKVKDCPYPALITGDFNINSRHPQDEKLETEEYSYLVARLGESGHGHHKSIKDLLKQSYNFHPVTYADVHPDDSKKPRESALTHPADHCTQLSIDYIFYLDTIQNEQRSRVKCSNTKVEEFFLL